MPEDSQKNHSPMIDCDCFMSKSGAVNLVWDFSLIGRLRLKKNIPLELI